MSAAIDRWLAVERSVVPVGDAKASKVLSELLGRPARVTEVTARLRGASLVVRCGRRVLDRFDVGVENDVDAASDVLRANFYLGSGVAAEWVKQKDGFVLLLERDVVVEE